MATKKLYTNVAPSKQGQLRTSMQPIQQSSPRRPTKQGGQVVGNYPINFGVGSMGKSSGRGGRKKMY